MTRVIKARALSDTHTGRLVSWEGVTEPARLTGVTTSLRFAYLIFEGPAPSVSVGLDDDITIHD
jgi:hypothetical protein